MANFQMFSVSPCYQRALPVQYISAGMDVLSAKFVRSMTNPFSVQALLPCGVLLNRCCQVWNESFCHASLQWGSHCTTLFNGTCMEASLWLVVMAEDVVCRTRKKRHDNRYIPLLGKHSSLFTFKLHLKRKLRVESEVLLSSEFI